MTAVKDGVDHDADIAMITPRNGGNDVVVPQPQYESMAQTLYFMFNFANAAHLDASIAQHKADQANRRVY